MKKIIFSCAMAVAAFAIYSDNFATGNPSKKNGCSFKLFAN